MYVVQALILYLYKIKAYQSKITQEGYIHYTTSPTQAPEALISPLKNVIHMQYLKYT